MAFFNEFFQNFGTFALDGGFHSFGPDAVYQGSGGSASGVQLAATSESVALVNEGRILSDNVAAVEMLSASASGSLRFQNMPEGRVIGAEVGIQSDVPGSVFGSQDVEIVNAGQVFGTMTGIAGGGRSLKVVNSGDISSFVTGVQMDGAEIPNVARSIMSYLELVNDGTISAREPVYVTNAFLNLRNTGDIVATANSATNAGTILGLSAIDVQGFDPNFQGDDFAAGARILNTGLISSVGSESTISLTGAFQSAPEIINAGVIDNGIYALIDQGMNVTNSGTIYRSVTLQKSFLDESPDPHELTLDNSGTIAGFVSVGTAQLQLVNTGHIDDVFASATEDDMVTNSGWIGGDIFLGGGNDSYVGTLGQVGGVVSGGAGVDRLYGGAQDDELLGGTQSDRLEGGGGDDLLDGGASGDRLYGGAGEDHLIGDRGNDRLFGGSDDDLLEGGAQNDELRGARGDDDLQGGSGEDLILGGSGEDTLSGGDDNDTLNGGGGADVLDGGAGKDILDGGRGDDILTGGADADVFVFAGARGDDVVTDFVAGEDLLDLTAFDLSAAGVAGLKQSGVLTDSGAGAVLTLGPAQTALLIGVASADLSDSDFLF